MLSPCFFVSKSAKISSTGSYCSVVDAQAIRSAAPDVCDHPPVPRRQHFGLAGGCWTTIVLSLVRRGAGTDERTPIGVQSGSTVKGVKFFPPKIFSFMVTVWDEFSVRR